jgi:ABC-type multidrug transport system permease subunit
VGANAEAVKSLGGEQARESSGGGGRAARGAAASSQSFSPLVELTLARVRETLREPEVIFWVFVFPVLLAFALGIAFRNTGPEKMRVAVESDAAQGGSDPAAATLAQRLSASEEIAAQVLSPAEAARALRSGKVAVVVRASEAGAAKLAGDTPEGGEAGEAGGAAHAFTYRYDPTRPESRQARLLVDDTLQRALGRADVARAGEERVTEAGGRYIDFLIPGLLGMNLMGSGLWGVGFAIVTARLRKLLKRLAATPMTRAHYLLSFVGSRMVFLFLEVTVLLVFARLAFGYRVQGSYLSMVALLLTGALAFAGVGLLVASRAQTIEGVSGLMNLVMLPMWLLSGTFFSAARFPEFLQPFIKVLPLTALNDALRAVMNEASPLGGVWAALAILVAWCVVSFALALRLFRWQ